MPEKRRNYGAKAKAECVYPSCIGDEKAAHIDPNGFGQVYKIFCIDIDGISTGENPFGYGIRADGKIISGARADEWMAKSLQKGNNE